MIFRASPRVRRPKILPKGEVEFIRRPTVPGPVSAKPELDPDVKNRIRRHLRYRPPIPPSAAVGVEFRFGGVLAGVLGVINGSRPQPVPGN